MHAQAYFWAMTNAKQFRGAFITVTSLFFMWGFITVLVDALIPRLKDVFELTYLQAGLVQFAWFTAYGLISIPGGRMIKRMGYKNGILAGLSLAAILDLLLVKTGLNLGELLHFPLGFGIHGRHS